MSIASIPHLLSSELVHHITTNQENLNLQTLFGASKYSSSINKRVIIASGVTIGATSTGNYALNMPSGFGGRLVLVNEGSILAAGGAANGGTGGNAINAGASNIFIDNRGYIYAGGGGGGRGGNGGNGGSGGRGGNGGGGVYYTSYSYNCDYCNAGGGSGQHACGGYSQACSCQNPSAYSCSCNNPNNGSCCNGSINGKYACCNCTCCYRRTCSGTNTNYTSGGTGGSGGRGQGYDAGAATGSAGTGGGTNAGAGGTGGTGGSYGNSGDTGNSGANGNNGSGSAGTAGGLAGFYIVNNGNVTWLANGTRNGRIG